MLKNMKHQPCRHKIRQAGAKTSPRSCPCPRRC